MDSQRLRHDWETKYTHHTSKVYKMLWDPKERGLTARWKRNQEVSTGFQMRRGDEMSLEPKRKGEKVMAPHSSTLAWKIPWTEEPGRLQSMGSQRVGHDWVTSLSLFTFMHWRRKWQPTPVFLLGESQGRGSLVGCRLWGRTESDTTKVI